MSQPIRVVAAVITRGGAVLCAQRSSGDLAGLWEFPGGKVEAGESPQDALRREIREELACDVVVGDAIMTTLHETSTAAIELTTIACTLGRGEPTALEHAALAWVTPDDLSSLAWAPADLPTVHALTARSGE